jgi:NAD(P)-dependent dehydrogenase (short-subunit alcohol dehydrogenase family)
MSGLVGKSVIVTGGGSGIGRATAALLGEAGCFVTIADVNETGGRQAAADIVGAGRGKAQFIRTDVADEAAVKAMVAAAEKTYGHLAGAVNSAGLAQRGVSLSELTLADWDRVHTVNLRGMFLCLKYEIEAMKRAGGGSIVAVSAGAAVMGVPNSAEYCASKAGINGLVRGAAVDCAAQNIRINAILPGGTRTPMLAGSLEEDPALQRIIDTFPMKRLAEPREIAAAIVWLLSDEASYVTGASWPVDGALTFS